jgi:hypothetical protein
MSLAYAKMTIRSWQQWTHKAMPQAKVVLDICPHPRESDQEDIQACSYAKKIERHVSGREA